VESTADPLAIAEGHRSNCHLPLISRERVLGVQSLGSIGENAFPEDDAALPGQVAPTRSRLRLPMHSLTRQIRELKDQLSQEKVYLEDEIRTEIDFCPDHRE
jgi:formate hydrogenlyase transcriptional activator